mgnify:CR=1 FL=1
MPKKKFGPDDVFFNTVKTYPQYTFSYYFNQAYINNRQEQGNRVQSGSVSLFEINVDREQGTDLVQPYVVKGESQFDFVFTNVTGNVSVQDYNKLPYATQLTGAYPLTSSIPRERLIGNGSGPTYTKFDILDGVSFSGSIRKVIALQNVFEANQIRSEKFNFNEYYLNETIVPNYTIFEEIASPKQKHMTLFSFPEIFKGQRIKPGSVELNFYVTGTLIATAKDTRRNGELIETFGPSSSAKTVIGAVAYSEGAMLITGNHNLNDTVLDGYLCPVTGTTTTAAGPGKVALQAAWRDNPKWVHFGAYQSFITSSTDLVSGAFGPASSSYELKFEGTNVIPTLTMFAHADKNEFNWSNNLTYLDREFATGSTYQKMIIAQTGSALYKEKEEMVIKNTISSSFANYSSSYQDQTFISKINIYDEDDILIGTAKLAKPVTKTNSTDYTFKLKIDL